MLSNRERKLLAEQICNLGFTEHLEILKIIQDNDINHSENNNGVFFNMTSLSDDVITKISDFVNYCYENKYTLDEYDRKLHECKYSNDISTFITGHVFESSIKDPLKEYEKPCTLMENITKAEKVKDFIESIHSSSEKPSLKRTNTKYTMAKKKFCRKCVIDNTDLTDILEAEEYE